MSDQESRRQNDVLLGQIDGRMTSLEGWVTSIDGKLDELVAAANMGRGAWWALIKLGGILVVLAGALAWVYEHLIKVVGK